MRASCLGAALVWVVFLAILLAPHFDLFGRGLFDNFYDTQARSLLHGHWDAPPGSYGFEAFVVDGRTNTYFGPVPALLRMPVLLVTHRLDGRLTRLYLLLAFTLTLGYLVALHWQVRELVRGGAPVTRAEQWAVGALTFVFGGGSIITFLASRAAVYHEAILWALAFWAASTYHLVRWLRAGRGAHFAAAAVFAGAGFLSRVTIGAAPVVAIAMVLGARLLQLVAGRWREGRLARAANGTATWVAPGSTARVPLGLLALAVVVPIALYAYVNIARFGTPFRLPIEDQVLSRIDPHREEVLHKAGGLNSPVFLPTNVVQFFRPDGVDATPLFPWLTFRSGSKVIGDVEFLATEPAGSIPATMPLLFVLSIAGVWTIVRGRRAPLARLLRAPLVGGVVGGVATLTTGYIANRYLTDLMPVLIVGGLAGFHGLWDARPRVRAGVRRAVTIAMVVIAAFGVWSMLSLTVLYQRLYSPGVEQPVRAGFVAFQQDVDRKLFGDGPRRLERGAALPEPVPNDSLFVVGDCDGVYWGDGRAWSAVEQTPRTGLWHFRFTAAPPRSGREPLVALGTSRFATAVTAQTRADGRVVFSIVRRRVAPGSTTPVDAMFSSRPVTVHGGDDLVILTDVHEGDVSVRVNGQFEVGYVVGLNGSSPAVGRTTIPLPGVDDRFSGRLQEVVSGTPLCRHLLDRG